MIFKKLRNRVMEYKYRLIIYLILLALTLGLAIALQVIAFPIKVLNIKDKATNNIDKCYVMAPNIPYYPESEVQAIVYKPVVNYNPVIKDHEKLIDCLIRYESNGNENAINPCDIDGRPKYGLLQFDARTFETYCVQRYKLPDDIFNGDVQRYCCMKMISDGQAHQWGTLNLCLK